MNRARILQFAIAAFLCLCGSEVIADTQPLTETQLAQRAQDKFNAGDMPGALEDYRATYRLSPTALNAIRVFLTSTYVYPRAKSADELSVWLARKRADAQRLGDNEVSWSKVEDAVGSLRFNIDLLEKGFASVRAQGDAIRTERDSLRTAATNLTAQLDSSRQEVKRLGQMVAERDNQLQKCSRL
jgi:hypothetical protein